jgi:AGCS family alanine or glycine:cation symporter
MIVAALFGMTAKFVECTLGQKYRTIDSRGEVLGGPMRYLEVGLKEKGMGGLGKVLAVMFAIFCIGGSFGGGNMFQANQAVAALTHTGERWFNVHLEPALIGLVLVVAVGIVILGGIRRIAATAEKIVPLMCGMYLIAAAFVVAVNLEALPDALSAIINGAFNSDAVEGGVIGVLVIGMQRAAFSNEAGIGSASIAHSAARTDEPVREGIVALLEPFIDTVIVCLGTALVIVVSGVLDTPEAATADGAVLTSLAFESAISWFPLLLTGAILLFAFSTMISWSYYGERCWTNLFGPKSSMVYRVIFLIFIFIGSVTNLGAVLDFSDLMILSMAFPNILGLYILSGDVRKDLDAYMSKLKDGGFKTYK